MANNFLRNKNKGFTLIEILVVIAIIGLLSSIILISVNSIRQKAKIAVSLNLSSQIYHAFGADIIGEWKFEDNLNDTSGNNNNGIFFSGEPTYESSGDIDTGKALSLNGGQYVSIPYSQSLDIISYTNPVTLEFWMKPANLDFTSIAILSNWAQFYLYLNSGGVLLWGVRESTSTMLLISTFNNVIRPGEWHHIALTYGGGGQAKIFINAEEKQFANRITLSSLYTSPGPIYIGGWPTMMPKLNGLIDEVRIYSGSFNLGQIKKLYAEGMEKRGLLVKK